MVSIGHSKLLQLWVHSDSAAKNDNFYHKFAPSVCLIYLWRCSEKYELFYAADHKRAIFKNYF